MGEDLTLVEEFHRRGARYMGIAHNEHSQLGDSHTPAEPLHGGLSELGKRAIAEMNRVGIMVDVSHSSRDAMMQALEVSKAPVIASHSGCRAVFDHTRNLDDAQLLALQKNGGVIQIVALGAFVTDQSARRRALDALRKELDIPSRWELWRLQNEGDGVSDEIQAKLELFERRKLIVDELHPEASVRDVVDHIDHAVETIGIDHVGIGSDFDGGGCVVGWNDASETFNVTLELVRRGYSAADIAKIWSGNTLRVWQAVADHAERQRQDPGK
jgi:membrane dipeptidase